MKLEISVNVEREFSKRASEAMSFLENTSDPKIIADYLNAAFSGKLDNSLSEDLRCWIKVLEKLDLVLSFVVEQMNQQYYAYYDSLTYVEVKYIACSVLRFLSSLMNCSKDKRFFMSFEQICKLMRSPDLDVAGLAVEVVFHVCIPSSSISSNLNDDWVDSIEVPEEVAKSAFLLFDSLCFMSTEVGITDYLRGHEPACIDISSGQLDISFPARNEQGIAFSVGVVVPESVDKVNSEDVEQLALKYELTPDEQWSLLNVRRALAGFQSTLAYRNHIVALRMRCFFIVVHSRHVPPTMHEYLKASSVFMRDLVDLSDLSSEVNSRELSAGEPLALASMALENILGLLESKLRRRNASSLPSHILSALGLQRLGHGGAPTIHTGAQDEAWASIVVASCTASSALFETQSVQVPGESLVASVLLESNPASFAAMGNFVRIGLELYALSLTTREPGHVVQDMSLISTIISVIQSAVPRVKTILNRRVELKQDFAATPTELQIMLVVAKALYCLELTVERSGYITAFRESDGMLAVTKIVEAFSNCDLQIAAAASVSVASLSPCSFYTKMETPIKSVLESALSVLRNSIQKGRQQIVLQNAHDTGAREVYQTYFVTLCCSVFASPMHQNEILWSETLTILKEAIDMDPPFLAQFLSAPASKVFARTIQASLATMLNVTPEDEESVAPSVVEIVDFDILLGPLVRIAAAVNITLDGKLFLSQSKLVDFIIECLVQPTVILPKNLGLTAERLAKVGKYLSQIMTDYEVIKAPTRKLLKDKLLTLSEEAIRISNDPLFYHMTDLSSPRVQVIQKLANICVVMESMLSENRRQYAELMREVMTEGVCGALIGAFQCTMPPARQLFAQISIRSNSTFPFFGHHPSAKALNQLLRMTATALPQSMLTVLFRSIEQQLVIIAECKQNLCTITKNCNKMCVDVDLDESPTDAKTANTSLAGVASVASAGANVHIVGVLDCFPHLSIIDPSIEEHLTARGDSDDDLEHQSWKFVTATLMVGWLSTMLGQALRSVQKLAANNSITAGKDSFRRLFAFYRSTMLEICRFGSLKWNEAPWKDCRVKKGLLESFSDCNSKTDQTPIERVPSEYVLRITGSGGALIRECIDIEGSRVVLVADVGTELTAYERKTNSAGVVRYRTAHGWLSEFRRDHSRSPIIELIRVSGIGSKQEVSVGEDEKQNELAELFSFREAISGALTRSCPAIKQVATYLCRAMTGNEVNSRNGYDSTYSSMLSVSICKIVKGYYLHPLNCLNGINMKTEWKNVLKYKEDTSLPIEAAGDETSKSFSRKTAKRQGGDLSASSSSSEKRIKLFNVDEEVKSSTGEGDSAFLDASSLCLYYGAVVKHILIPFIEEKNGNFNIYLLRTFCNQGVIDNIMNSLVFIITVLRDEIESALSGADSNSDKELTISREGRCAVHALPLILGFLRKLVNRDLFTKSTAATNAGTSLPTDEVGPYQTHDLLFNVLQSVGTRMVSLFQTKLYEKFPADIQMEWYTVISELFHNLQTPLPSPKEISSVGGVALRRYGDLDRGFLSSATGRSLLAGERARVDRGYGATPPSAVAASPVNTAGGGESSTHVPRGIAGLRAVSNLIENIRATRAEAAREAGAAVSATGSSGTVAGEQLMSNSSSSNPIFSQSVPTMLTTPMVPSPEMQTSMAETLAELHQETEEMEEVDDDDLELMNAIALSMSSLVPPQEPQTAATSAPDLVLVPDVVDAVAADRQDGEAMQVDSAESRTRDGLPNLVMDLDTSIANSAVTSAAVAATPTADSATGLPPAPTSDGLSRTSLLQEYMNQHMQRNRPADNSTTDAISAPPSANSVNTSGTNFSSLFSTRTPSVSSPWESIMMPPAAPEGGRPPAPPSIERPPSAYSKEQKSIASPKPVYADFNNQTAKLKVISEGISSQIIENVVHLCSMYSLILRWETKHDVYLLPQLCDVVVRANLDASEVKFSDLIQRVQNRIKEEAASPAGNFYGLLYFLTTFVHDLKGKKECDQLMEKAGMIPLVQTIIEAIFSTLNSGMKPVWPKWFSPAFVFFYELLALDFTPSEEKETSAISGSSSSASGATSPGKSLSVASGVFPGTSAILDTSHYLPNGLWSRLFEVSSKMIDSVSADFIIPDADIHQALMMVVEQLLFRQEFVARFVENNHLKAMLKWRTTEEINDSDRQNNSKVWTLIAKKCLETQMEIQKDFTVRIRKLFAEIKEERKTLTVEKLIKPFSIDIIRSPEDFWAAVNANTKLVKVPAKDSSSKQAHDLVFMLVDADKVSAEQLQRCESSDARAIKSLRLMVKHIISCSRLKLKDPEAYKKIVYPPSVVLDSLSDALLSLRRVPHLLTSLIGTENDFWKLKSNGTFIDFLVRNCFVKSINLNEVKTSSTLDTNQPQNVDLWCCSRFLVAMCAFKGPSKTLTLSSVLNIFSANTQSLKPSGDDSQSVVSYRNEDTKRILILTRLAKLISIMIHSSKSTLRDSSVSKQEGVSVDTVQYLVLQGNLLHLLTSALMSIPLNLPDASKATSSILELLELITRPKLQALFENKQTLISADKTSTSSAASHTETSADECIDLMEEASSPLDGLSPTRITLDVTTNGPQRDGDDDSSDSDEDEEADANDHDDRNDDDMDEEDGEDDDGGLGGGDYGGGDGGHGGGHDIGGEEDDDDGDNPDEDEEGDRDHDGHGDEEEEGDEEDEDDDEDDEDDEDDDDDDDDEDGSGDDNDGRGLLVPPDHPHRFFPDLEDSETQGTDDSYVNVGNFLPSSSRLNASGGGETFIMRNVQMPGSMFASSPGSMRHELSNIFGRDDGGESDPLDNIVAAIQHARAGSTFESSHNLISTIGQLFPNMVDGTTLTPSAASISEQLLPQGIDVALHVDHPVLTHPMLNRSMSASHVPSRSSLQSPSLNASRFYSVPGLPASLSGGRAILPYGGVRGMMADDLMEMFDGVAAENPNEMDGLFHDWPRPAVAPASASRSARSNNAPVPSTATNILRQIEAHLNQNLDNIETYVETVVTPAPVPPATSDDQSQFSNSSERGQTLDGVASVESSLALLGTTITSQPGGERAGGHEIPSNIDVTSPEQEVEDLSVITLPQEDTPMVLDNSSVDLDLSLPTHSVVDAVDDSSMVPASQVSLGVPSASMEVVAEAMPTPIASVAAPDPPASEIPAETVSHEVAAAPSTTQEMEVAAAVHGSEPVDWTSSTTSSSNASASVDAAAASSSAVEAPTEEHRLQCPTGYDSDVFYSLPEDVQQEIIDQYGDSNSNSSIRELAALAGFDYDTLMALPEDVRQEVLDQARRDQAAARGASSSSGSGAAPSEIDNASFLMSLTSELRADVLLTADAEFLATLPPELVAEAQMVRERAATSWQRRELAATSGAAHRAASAAAAAPHTAAQGGEGDDGDDYYDSEGEGDEDPDGEGDDGDRHGGMYLSRQSARNRKPAAERVKNGIMRCPLSQKSNYVIPTNLLVAIAKTILCPVKDSPFDSALTSLQFKLFQNLAVTALSKDVNLRLLVSLVTQESSMLKSVIAEVSNGESSIESLKLGDAKGFQGFEVVHKPALTGKHAVSDDQHFELSTAAVKRVVDILYKLSASNASFLYLLLQARSTKFAMSAKEIEKLSPATDNGAAAAESSTATLALSNPPATIGSMDVVGSPMSPGRNKEVPIESSNALFELLVNLLSSPVFANNVADFEALVRLIDLISSPLEHLPEGPKTDLEVALTLPSPSGHAVTAEPITAEMKAKDAKQGIVSVHVPQVILRRESLSSLCDVLMNDLCTKKVFSYITSTISRLAKIAKNNAILLELIFEVIIDMSEQSQSKMNQLSQYLHEVQVRYIEVQRADGFSKSSPSSSSSSSSSNSKSVKFNDAQGVKLPCSLLPLGESGGRQHDRLLRVVQTLQSMAAKTNRNLLDVMPVEQLTSLWSTLEAVLTHLRSYLVDADEDKDSSTETIRPQTTLTSILNRMLPVIEAFFLVHTHDLLSPEKTTATSSGPATGNDAASVSSSSSAPPSASAAGTSSVAAPGSDLISPSSMPGYKYRTSPQYLRNNLSLFADGADVGLTSVRSLRKQNSFTSTSSITRGGIPARSQKLLSFAQAHKGVLNLIVKSKPALLETSFSAFVRVIQLRSLLKFDNKRKYFFTQLKRSNQSISRRGVHLQVRRNQVFEDTFHQMRVRTAEELRGRLQVNFYGEEGVDAGGLTREWYVILSREIFNPNYALFLAAADGATFQPNPFSMINTNHLDYFKFVGRIIGKAICDGQLMDAHFTRSFYKHLLGMPVEFTDIEATEPDYYKTLKQILETPLDLLMMDLTFSAENQKFGINEVMDLIPNGRNIPVTDENKADYIRLIAHHRMTSAIRSQIDSFLNGFYDLVPPELISIFSPAELELLICGLPDVNIDELQANTEYHQYKATDEVIVWFWEELRSYNREERASFLQFVTGTSKVPLGGFANLQGMRGNQRFSIHRAYGDTGQLPTAHTCFNQLDLPAYATRQELKEKLAMAVNEGCEGFGFA